MANPYIMSVLFVCGLLLVGVALRAGVRPIRALFIPASVVGGLIGLAVIQAGLRVGPAEVGRAPSGDLAFQRDIDFRHEALEGITLEADDEANYLAVEEAMESWRAKGAPASHQRYSIELSNTIDGWPGLLIAVVFAGLLIERPGKRFSEAAIRAGRQGIVVWIIILGQIALGLLATALVIQHFYDIPRPFGQLIETGFAGGHGTAAAMGQVMAAQPFNFAAGRDLAFLFATFGLVWGTVSGIALINIGVRRGWTATKPPLAPGEGGPKGRVRASESEAGLPPDPHPPAAPAPSPGGRGGPEALPTAPAAPISQSSAATASPRSQTRSGEAVPLGFARIRSEIIDPFAFQLCLLAAAFAIGYAMQQAFLALAGLVADQQAMGYVGNIPLFLFTLLGGWVLREAMHLLGIGHLIDPPSINRLTGIAMEFLIVAALATLRIEAAAEYFWPVVLLLTVGCAWCVFCLLWLSRRLLPKEYWFELGLINYGMSTATTAQGLMLLRIVDPDLESGAAEDYAAAAPLSAPFIGGGVLTVLGIPLALSWGGYWPVVALCAAMMIGLYVLGRMLGKADDERGERRGFEVIR